MNAVVINDHPNADGVADRFALLAGTPPAPAAHAREPVTVHEGVLSARPSSGRAVLPLAEAA